MSRRILIAAGVAGLLLAGAALAAVLLRRYLARLGGRRRPVPAGVSPPDVAEARRATGAAGEQAARSVGLPLPPTWDEPSAPVVEAAPLRLQPGRVALVVVPGLTLVGGIFFLTVGAPWLLGRQHVPTPPVQPIRFSHEVHVQQIGLDCAFCHRTADRADTAGLPDVQQCMFCHLVVDDLRQTSEQVAYAGQIDRLRGAWTAREPIDWARVHRLPDHSRFPHDAHVQAGVPCATCHGPVEQMDLTRQVRSLKMGDCVACHQETGAPNECADCHY